MQPREVYISKILFNLLVWIFLYTNTEDTSQRITFDLNSSLLETLQFLDLFYYAQKRHSIEKDIILKNA